jgi:predicted deacylase
MVVEAGGALRLYRENCSQLLEGIFSLMRQMGIWDEPCEPVRQPMMVNDDNIAYINCECSGTFVEDVNLGARVLKGDVIGRVVEVLTGSVEETLIAPVDGILFSLRAYPLVEEGSLIARIVKTEEHTGGVR